MKKKKVWKKPKLVVLFRGKPEEAVLQACKTDIAGDSRAVLADRACYAAFAEPCGLCSDIMRS